MFFLGIYSCIYTKIHPFLLLIEGHTIIINIMYVGVNWMFFWVFTQ